MAISEPPNPLHGISHDSAYINNFLDQIPGPVIAVAHSYGAVITNAASGADNVVGLVYVVAFAPDNGETLACVGALGPARGRESRRAHHPFARKRPQFTRSSGRRPEDLPRARGKIPPCLGASRVSVSRR